MKKKESIDDLHFQVMGMAPRPQDVRRARILETVIKILARDGIDELTFERIGKKVGMARSHVVYYFKNREELVIAAIRFAALSAQRIVQAHLDPSLDWREALKRYVEGNFAWLKSHPEHATVYTLLYYLGSYKPEYRKLHSEIREAGRERIIGILERGPLKGKRRQLETMAKGIQGIITGNLIDLKTTDQQNQSDERLRQTLAIVDQLVESVH